MCTLLSETVKVVFSHLVLLIVDYSILISEGEVTESPEFPESERD